MPTASQMSDTGTELKPNGFRQYRSGSLATKRKFWNRPAHSAQQSDGNAINLSLPLPIAVPESGRWITDSLLMWLKAGPTIESPPPKCL